MTEPLLRTAGLTKRYGGLVATDNLDFEVAPREVHAVIGPNGAGKTTLVAQLSGEIRPNGGRILFAGEDITRLPAHARALRGLARSFQVTCLCLEFTAIQNVVLAMYARSPRRYDCWRRADRDARLYDAGAELLREVGLANRSATIASELAHGEQRQLEVAIALAMEPRILLLDEPTAGMGRQESTAMVDLLLRLKGRYAMVLVEHDMNAVFRLADRISVLVYGRCVATGRPEDVRADPAVRTAYLGEEAALA
jgi:branched-chain amino acid transport system ATP-binding protein